MKLQKIAEKLGISVNDETLETALFLIKNRKFRETLDREALFELINWAQDDNDDWEVFLKEILNNIDKIPKKYTELFDREIMLALGLKNVYVAMSILASELTPDEHDTKFAKILVNEPIDSNSATSIPECITQLCIKHPEIAELIFSSDENTLNKWRDYITNTPLSPILLSRILGSCRSKYSPQHGPNSPYEFIWSKYSSKIVSGNEEEQHEKNVLVGESPIYAGVIICDYFLNIHRYKKLPDSIITLGKNWPEQAQAIIRQLPKDNEHLPYINELIPSLISAADSKHLYSQLTIAFLHFTGITKLIPHDLERALKLCLDACERHHHHAYPLLILFADCYRDGRAFTITSNEGLAWCKNDSPIHQGKKISGYLFKKDLKKVEKLIGHAVKKDLKKAEELYEYAARYSTTATSRLLNPKFCLELARYYLGQRNYIKAMQLYKKVTAPQYLAEIKLEIAVSSADALNYLVSHSEDINLCLYFAEEYLQFGNPDIAQRLIKVASQQDSTVYKQEFCHQLAITLVEQGKFAEAHALFSAIPSDATTYKKVTNFLKWHGNQSLDNTPNIAIPTPLISREEQIQYLLILYKAADQENHSEAHKIVQQLEQELRALKDPTQPAWLPMYFGAQPRLPQPLQNEIHSRVESTGPN